MNAATGSTEYKECIGKSRFLTVCQKPFSIIETLRYDDPNVPIGAVVAIVGVTLTFVSVVLLQALFFYMQEDEMERKVYSQTNEELRSLKAEQTETLNSYGWVDQTNGVAHIPINNAMDLIVAENRK